MGNLAITNRHFPTWKIKVLPPVTFPTAPPIFPNPESVQPQDSTDRSHQRPRDQLFTLHWDMYSIVTSTRTAIYLSAPSGFDPLVLLFERFLGTSAFWEMLSIYSYSLLKFVLPVNARLNSTCLGVLSKLPNFRSFKQNKTGTP